MRSERYIIALVIVLVTIWIWITVAWCFFRRRRRSKLDTAILELEIDIEDAQKQEKFTREYSNRNIVLPDINTHDNPEIEKSSTESGAEQIAAATNGYICNTALERFWKESDVPQFLEVEDDWEILFEQSGSLEKTALNGEVEINDISISTTEKGSVEDKIQWSTEDLSQSSFSSSQSSSISNQ